MNSMKTISIAKSASKGIAIGKAFIVGKVDISADRYSIEFSDIESEQQRFKKAIDSAVAEIEILAEKSEIFAAHVEIAQDEALLDSVQEKITDEFKNAELSLEEATAEICLMFESLDDEYLKERASDIKDVSKRIMCHLKGISLNSFDGISEEVIVIADDLTPSDTAMMNFDFVKGFITAAGGVTSHVAIIARQLEVPAMVGVSQILTETNAGDTVVLDGIDNQIIINPDDMIRTCYVDKGTAYLDMKEQYKAMSDLPAETKDGHVVELFANVGSIADVEQAVKNGSEGIGLFRTELLYMDSQQFPTEAEQFAVYKEAIEKNHGPMIVRTLDIGGDKSLPYYQFDFEENPFLGWRAIRICLELKDMFKAQLRALLKASAFGDIRIMYPMIISVDEFRLANEVLEECKLELKLEGIDYNDNIETGVMIETPASVFVAEDLAKEVDFFSIGTNDLTQYILAVDRGNQRISNLYNTFNPAVLRAIKTVIDAGHKYGKIVGMCGEFASDEKGMPLLLGLGLDEFSMASSAIAECKFKIRNTSYKEAKEYADSVLENSSIAEMADLGLF